MSSEETTERPRNYYAESYDRTVRQSEFLNRLSKLMNEFQADFSIEDCGDDGRYILVSACGSWIPYHEVTNTFNVDDCIAATAATIEHAKALQPSMAHTLSAVVNQDYPASAEYDRLHPNLPDAIFPQGTNDA